MQARRFLSIAGRVLTVSVAVVGAIGVVDCATFGPRYNRAAGALPTRALLGEVLSGAPGTYINRLLAERDSTLERWPERTNQPLRVWIDSSATIGGEQAGFPQAVRAAFAQWLDTGIPIRLVYVRSARDANIRVRWTEHLSKKTGSTTWRTDRVGYLTSGDITLATHVSDGQALDARGMRAIALHEVGHALGLSHSPDAGDIMAPLVRVDELSESDRGTLKLLYTLPAGHVR